MYTFRNAQVQETEKIAIFLEHVINTSVDASESEKTAFIENVRSNLVKWQAQPERSFHLVAFDDKELVGVVLALEFWNMCHLFILPEHQSRGLGRSFVQRALAACAAKLPCVTMRLNASRNAAGFYKHLGFAERPGKAHVLGSIPLEKAP